jgi:hypothetical protein
MQEAVDKRDLEAPLAEDRVALDHLGNLVEAWRKGRGACGMLRE